MTDRLKQLRDRIDWLDGQIASLLNERMKIADEVGNIKRACQQAVLDSNREQKVLDGVEAAVQHPVLKEHIGGLYREIIKEARVTQHFHRYGSQPFRSIGIIGLGLMGGSLCKSIRSKDPSVTLHGLAYGSDALLALEGKWIDCLHDNLESLVTSCELLVLACPLSKTIEIAKAIKHCTPANQKRLVIDISSVKGFIVDAFSKLNCEGFEFVGTHPMAGREKNGFVNSQATLFVNRPWIITPHAHQTPDALSKVEQLILFLGGEPIHLTATCHDEQVALVSHLPALLATAFFDFVKVVAPDSVKVAGPGFEGFTRLAHSNPQLREDILDKNNQAIAHHLEQFIHYLEGRSWLNTSLEAHP